MMPRKISELASSLLEDHRRCNTVFCEKVKVLKAIISTSLPRQDKTSNELGEKVRKMLQELEDRSKRISPLRR
jgi:hypothetical protein